MVSNTGPLPITRLLNPWNIFQLDIARPLNDIRKCIILFISLGTGKDQTLLTEKKFFASIHQMQKKPVYADNFSVSFFHLLTYTNPDILMDAKQ